MERKKILDKLPKKKITNFIDVLNTTSAMAREFSIADIEIGRAHV